MNVEFIFPLNQLHWWLGLALLASGLTAWALVTLERRRQARLHAFVEQKLAPRLLPGYDAALRRPLFWLVLAGLVALCLAFSQPHWGQSWQKERHRSRDILVVLDTSESMRAANPLPDRLERAKQKIASILDRAPADRFGLIAFSGGAALQCPLTRDQGYFKAVLDAVDTDTISEKGTDIASALKEAVKTYKDEDERTGQFNRDARAIILISDGEQASDDASVKARDAAVAASKEAGKYAHLHVIGVGDPNGAEIRLPDWMGRYVQVRDGDKPHLSKLDEETLTKIALEGNGGYVRSTPDNSDINQIYDLIGRLAMQDVSSDVRLRLVNRYQWPLALAILCFAAEGLWLALLPRIRMWRARRRPARDEEKAYV